MAIRTLIVDDEPLARRGLELRLQAHADIEIVGEAGNGRQAFHQISALKPDLMFLDVQMPGLDGFALLRAIPATQMPLTVFVTAYDQYALAAFAASALDYLLKPVDDARLDQSIERARMQLATRAASEQYESLLKLMAATSNSNESRLADPSNGDALAQHAAMGQPTAHLADKLTIKDGQRSVRVALDAIEWIDAAGDYMCIHAGTDTHVLRGTMHELEQRLDPRRFARVHRSTIVNLTRVKEMRPHLNGEYFLLLDSGHEIKLSRSYKDKVQLLV